MPSNHLTQGEISNIAGRWADEDRDWFDRLPGLAGYPAMVDEFLQMMSADQQDPQEAVRAAKAEVARLGARYDEFIRGYDAALEAHLQLITHPDERQEFEHARREVLPTGRLIINRPIGDKAAEARNMPPRLSPRTRAQLGRYNINHLSLLQWLEEVFIPLAHALDDAQTERVRVEDLASARSRGFNLVTRRRFFQIEDALRSTLALHDAPDVSAALLGNLDRMIDVAERRAAARSAGAAPVEPIADVPGVDPGAGAAAEGEPTCRGVRRRAASS
ncbi:MAG: hypothetical protein H6705_06120 [Myxococcales bacterium]|nr:hypothetical protein [Myxococcales bacterium]